MPRTPSCDHIYLGSTGHENAANVVLAEALRLAIALGLHDESVAMHQGLDAIEKETRRRVFWVLCRSFFISLLSFAKVGAVSSFLNHSHSTFHFLDGSDRTIAALISCPMLLSDDDIFVSDILEVDDSLITVAGAFPQAPGKTPKLSGFVHVTRIFRLLSKVIRLVQDRAHGQVISKEKDRLAPAPLDLVNSLEMLLDDLPLPLQLTVPVDQAQPTEDLQAFDVCKANILVTQVLVRFAIRQYAALRARTSPDQAWDRDQ